MFPSFSHPTKAMILVLWFLPCLCFRQRWAILRPGINLSSWAGATWFSLARILPVSEVRVTSTERSDKVIRATLFSGLERVFEWVIRFTASCRKKLKNASYNFWYYLLSLKPRRVEIPISHELGVVHANYGALQDHFFPRIWKKNAEIKPSLKSCVSASAGHQVVERFFFVLYWVLLLSRLLKYVYLIQIIHWINVTKAPWTILRFGREVFFRVLEWHDKQIVSRSS